MIAYELHNRSGLDSLVRVSRERQAVRSTDARIEVRAVSLNFRDLVIARGASKRRTARPIIPASDGAGEVVEVGQDVSRVKVGDRVAANFFPTWIDGDFSRSHQHQALGGAIDGMLTQEVVLDQQAWVHIPDHLSYQEAATLPCAGVTAYNALFESAHIRPGSLVVIQGTGGVSIFALQLAKAAGATAIVTSRSEAKRARASQLGADHLLDYIENPAWGEAVEALTAGRGADVVVEVGGAGTLDQSVVALRYGGTISLVGVLTSTRGDVDVYRMLKKTVRIQGIHVGSRRIFEALTVALCTSGVRPIIDSVFEFDEVRRAYEYLKEGRHFGKVVIRVS